MPGVRKDRWPFWLWTWMLWSLHLGHAWVAIGLAVIAFADLAGAIPWSVGVHAQTAGAIGTMVLAVMTRVALGHTGRPLVAPRAAVAERICSSANLVTYAPTDLRSSAARFRTASLSGISSIGPTS